MILKSYFESTPAPTPSPLLQTILSLNGSYKEILSTLGSWNKKYLKCLKYFKRHLSSAKERFKVDGFIFVCWHFIATFKILFQLSSCFPFFLFYDIHMTRVLACKFFSNLRVL